VPYRFGNPYTLALFVAAGVTFALAAAALRHRNERAGRAFSGFLVGIGLWSLGDAMRYAAPTEAAVMLWNRVGYLGIVVIPPTLLLFVLSYTGRERWFRPRRLGALVAVSVVAYAVVLTNPLHGLWFEVVSTSPGTAPPVLREDWGAAWYAWALYSYAVVVTVTYLMGREFLVASRSGTHRGQTGAILTGLLVASGVNALFVFEAVSFDPAPFVFTVTALCFAVAMFRYDLLTLLPVARDTVVQNMDSALLVLDDEDRLVDANRFARATFGLDETGALGAPIDRALSDHPAVRRRLTDGDGTGPVAVETGDAVRHYDVEVSTLTDALGATVGRVAVLTDITRRVEQQRRLRERSRDLEAANERLDGFASVVSHDLRNPLNVVVGRASAARRADDPEEHLAAIENAADRMTGMIDDLLALAQQGQTVGETEPVALDEAAEAAWAFTTTDAARLTCETSAVVRADPDRLEEALGNLFRNAVEHGSAGVAAEPDRTVADGAGDGDGVCVRVGALPDGFYVADDGPGIPDGERERVFETGYSTDPEGTGFGLNIVRTIVEAHGWRVEATESASGGARFEVTGVEFE
jgi:signal transduction histidine kinase